MSKVATSDDFGITSASFSGVIDWRNRKSNCWSGPLWIGLVIWFKTLAWKLIRVFSLVIIVKWTMYVSIVWGPCEPNVEIDNVSFHWEGKFNCVASLSIMKVFWLALSTKTRADIMDPLAQQTGTTAV